MLIGSFGFLMLFLTVFNNVCIHRFFFFYFLLPFYLYVHFFYSFSPAVLPSASVTNSLSTYFSGVYGVGAGMGEKKYVLDVCWTFSLEKLH